VSFVKASTVKATLYLWVYFSARAVTIMLLSIGEIMKVGTGKDKHFLQA